MSRITYSRPAGALSRKDTILLIAPQSRWKRGWPTGVLPADLARRVRACRDVASGPLGTVSGGTDPDGPRLVAGVLPDAISRHAAPARTEAVWNVARAAKLSGRCGVVALVDDPDHVGGVLAGLVRALPLYDRRTGGRAKTTVAFAAVDRSGGSVPVRARSREIAAGIREAARLVDTPTAELTTADFVREARKLVRGVPRVTSQVIVGDALRKAGLGGVYGVGQAAQVAPRMLVLSYKPPRPSRHVALVGKGVVYDTGGLHLKGRGSMESMKGDMGGGAAVVNAFRALAATGAKARVTALVPLAENAIDAASYRPDDILTLHSGHTVEINNTDAEGRLLLGDAVSYAARKLRPDAIVDMATLTGAQLIATGKSHAAVVSNREGLERLALDVGRAAGEPCAPLVFCPELHQAEFRSEVADMKNSVKDRMNAQSSCAAWFVYAQIDDLDVPWLHLDIAGPAWRHDRGTGFGVGLLAGIVDGLRKEHLA